MASRKFLPSFKSLPRELLIDIVIKLDPIGLISLSQASRYFRAFISPSRRDFVERLLQLELTEEYGGSPFEFHARYHQRLQLFWAGEQWQAIRWACTGCMRLLSHVHFDNKSLLRLKYRKPSSRSPDKILTTWLPTLRGMHWHSRRQQDIHDQEKERTRRKRYHIAGSYVPYQLVNPSEIHFNLEALRELGFEGLEDLDNRQFLALSGKDRLEIFDRNIKSIESERCGWKRHSRKCNECKYQENQLGRRADGCGGTPIFPIQTSRKIRFPFSLHRYFPNYWTWLQTDLMTPSTSGLFLDPIRGFDKYWTLYMVRCPGCQRWQEMRAFRLRGPSHKWKPKIGFMVGSKYEQRLEISRALLDHIRCNTCFARVHGRWGLGAALSNWFFSLLGKHQSDIESVIFWGWKRLNGFLWDVPARTQPALQLIINTMLEISEGYKTIHPGNLDAFRSLHNRFRFLWYAMPRDVVHRIERKNPGFDHWCSDFNRLVDYWVWIDASARE
ncbi:unnamed protein product [Clonostachys rosea]|uniref:F-box domain-containing protein n=1 Tax=Bionectria ochroleuca TaxID=29856 RepID=A0ABY6UBS2_BIOOC|nr:unnamed protein product [Clonostachys rosea]